MELAKLMEDGTLELINTALMRDKDITAHLAAGYCEFIPARQPKARAGYKPQDQYEIKDFKLIQSWELVEDKELVEDNINNLKEQLAATDYKVIKCMEASLTGEKLPYDINQLHKTRQELRDSINNLETKI